MRIRQAFILAAGYGTRLRPLTLETPKPLLPIGGKPLLSYHLENLEKNGMDKVFINTFYLSDQIDSFVENYLGKIDITVSHEEGEILGTAGGVMKQFENLDDTIVIVYGDDLTNFNYGKFFTFLDGKDFDVAIALYHEDHIEEKGMAIIDDKGYIQSFIEKPKKEQIVSNLANAGIYVVKKYILDEFCPHSGFFDFGHDLFPLLLEKNKKLLSYTMNEYLLDIGNMEKYSQANLDITNDPSLFVF